MIEAEKKHELPPELHAREYLASERTFLAWIRTSIAVIGFGFAVIKFDDWISTAASHRDVKPLYVWHVPIPVGGLMIAIGGIMAALGAYHYSRTNKQIQAGQVTPSPKLVFSVAGLVVLLSMAIILYLIFREAS